MNRVKVVFAPQTITVQRNNAILHGMDYQLVSSESAPDCRFIVTELHSLNEAGHAPYGQNLVLSRKKVNTPDEGLVVFAGYCKSLSYSWAANEEVVVSYEGSDTYAIKMKSTRVLGIKIKYR